MENEIFIPHNVMELYEKMDSEHFTGLLEIEKDALIWKLPNGIVLKVFIEKLYGEGYIEVHCPDYKKRAEGTHWHPTADEIYRDLCGINTGQTFWVKKKKGFAGPLIMDKCEWEKYSEKKKNKYVILS